MDREGVLRIGTRNALPRMADGQITSYAVQDSYGDARIKAITEDAEGNLWVAAGSELTRFAGTKLKPVVMRNPKSGAIEAIYQASPSKRGGIWIAAALGVRWWNNGKLTNFGAPPTAANTIVSAVHEMPDGTLYV